ncbi:SSS family solute:Na+ symporter [Mycoplasmoides fastidiosum]|uniref:SSS family solute:Na+ symporter n=1 Tax=Mycoplasmoides fastidiosum TaxID=92758 RepID=A0ABU0LZI7_9BACT|nr:hypothetical protein [Mycoplasmoides fastidiosum]MDQ0514120.1 SSS family solute:Na+ symporter [Mycoplasmoides fastidiosum]UUD37472.1 hypothetical protein NPA10_02780 [Mycoplasmoides fastidiosum]
MSPLDIVILVIYLIGVSGLGGFFWFIQRRRKQNSTNNFFTGGSKNPIWVVGLSIWATILSSLFFVNITGQVATGAWMWVGPNIALIGITPFVAMWVIPFYRRLKASTAYAYLQERFNYALRAINSASFIIFQIFRVAIVLFVPIIALTAVVDVSPYIMIVVVGIIVALLTAFGGFKAVIWADAIQGIVLLVGIGAVLIGALVKTNYGSDTLVYQSILTKESWKLSLAQGGISFLFLFNIINSMYAFMGSQDVTQRYKGTRNIAQIRKTLYISSFLGVITVLLFFGAGSALYTYYSTVPGADVNDLFKSIGVSQNTFMINFVKNALPIGFVGLILAAIFASSQSTISSGLSALANSIIVDFIQPITKHSKSDRYYLWFSRILVLVFGGAAILFGVVLIYVKQTDLLNYFTGFVGLLNAPTVAVFLLGIFSRRANSVGVLIGIIIGFIIGIPLWLLTQGFIPESARIQFHGVWLTLTTFFTTLILGYVFSLIANRFGHQPTPEKLVNHTMQFRTKEFKQLTRLESSLGKIATLVKKGQLSQEYLDLAEEKIEQLGTIVSNQ